MFLVKMTEAACKMMQYKNNTKLHSLKSYYKAVTQ